MLRTEDGPQPNRWKIATIGDTCNAVGLFRCKRGPEQVVRDKEYSTPILELLSTFDESRGIDDHSHVYGLAFGAE